MISTMRIKALHAAHAIPYCPYLQQRRHSLLTAADVFPGGGQSLHQAPSPNTTARHASCQFGPALLRGVACGGRVQSMDDSVVDFPFRVSPAEQEIIEMDPKPPCPMLLVGRSGTGRASMHNNVQGLPKATIIAIFPLKSSL